MLLTAIADKKEEIQEAREDLWAQDKNRYTIKNELQPLHEELKELHKELNELLLPNLLREAMERVKDTLAPAPESSSKYF